MHARHTLLVALAVLAVPLAGALPQQTAPQAHANTQAGPAPVADLPTAAQDADDETGDDVDTAEAADAGDDAAEPASNETQDEADEAAGNASLHGPDAELPAHVPDHVQRIHALIGQFLSGTLDGPLGLHISDVARPGNGR